MLCLFADVPDSSMYRVCMGDYKDNGLSIKEGDKIDVVDDSEDGKLRFGALE